MTTKKPFSVSHYSQDDNAKDLFIDWLKSKGWSAHVNPNRYGIDVFAIDPEGNNFQFEVEVKHNWKGAVFQYPTLHYSERKRKFLEAPENTAFVTLNHERTHAFMVEGSVLSVAETIVKDTIYTKDEKFIEVNVTDCKLIELDF